MNNFESPASGPLDSAVEVKTFADTEECFEGRRPRLLLTEADAVADLAGTPRPER